MTPARIIKFLKRYLLKHPLYVLVYGIAYFSKGFKFDTYFYSEEEIYTFLKEGKSLIRMGDGEYNLMLSLPNHYHAFSPTLKRMMEGLVKGYGPDSTYVLSIPRFINDSNETLRAKGILNIWLPIKVMFFLKFPKHVSYMDMHNSYRDGYFERVMAPAFIDKTVVIITNRKTIEKQSKNPKLPWKEVRYVETPEDNCLGAYDAIEQAVDKELANHAPETTVLFFAFGPVGKHMLKSYSEKGWQGLDTGKVTEIMFTGESIEWMI